VVTLLLAVLASSRGDGPRSPRGGPQVSAGASCSCSSRSESFPRCSPGSIATWGCGGTR
jgi:hypothetical protein